MSIFESNSNVEAKLNSLTMRVGIFFGGPSREREVSFAGGRTVYDNLDKTLFEAIPIFVDSMGQLILLDWPHIYKGTIRDFYPAPELLPPTAQKVQHYIESFPELKTAAAERAGRVISFDELHNLIDFAFLTLHGRYGEDGTIQAMLQQSGIPYSGSGIMACAIGMDKYAQKKLMASAGFDMPDMSAIERSDWIKDKKKTLTSIGKSFQDKVVIRPSKQGSSIGVSILDPKSELLESAIDAAFFRKKIDLDQWRSMSEDQKLRWLNDLTDVKSGLGLPVKIDQETYFTASDVANHFNAQTEVDSIVLEAIDSEKRVIAEAFIDGREFSCIVVRNMDGNPMALPPTEIVKSGQLFDYRSKYLPGLSRKETPINLESSAIEKIREECIKLYDKLQFGCYARIDGFYTDDGRVILNDPNTTSGMLPSSFFFHQAAEIGLNPSQFLTYIIYTSLMEREADDTLLTSFAQQAQSLLDSKLPGSSQLNVKKRVVVIFGGFSFERHISVESGRNIYEKLASSSKYEATPVFLLKHQNDYQLVEVPINLLLKDNADDIRDKILKFKIHPLISDIRKEAQPITDAFAEGARFEPRTIPFEALKEEFDMAFIALHGRPGEDGDLQQRLEVIGLPYNGSSSNVSSITINKFDTLQLLGSHQLPTTDQWLIEKEDYLYDPFRWLSSIEGKFGFPLIAKPVDDGCSSAVIKIKDQAHLETYLEALFRNSDDLDPSLRESLGLGWNEEFPQKPEVLIEKLIHDEKADLFMEITCGLLSEYVEGESRINIFEPSEALATGDVLTLEEKFLAGQGMNITPARLKLESYDYNYISSKVKDQLKEAALILGIEGYARIDAFVRAYNDGHVETVIIEVNSLPGMTPATCIYHQAALEGYKPYDFIDKILTFAEARYQKQHA